MAEAGFEVEIDTVAGRSYVLERCADLTEQPQQVWTQIGSPLNGNDALQSFTDPSPPDNAAYRIRIEVSAP